MSHPFELKPIGKNIDKFFKLILANERSKKNIITNGLKSDAIPKVHRVQFTLLSLTKFFHISLFNLLFFTFLNFF